MTNVEVVGGAGGWSKLDLHCLNLAGRGVISPESIFEENWSSSRSKVNWQSRSGRGCFGGIIAWALRVLIGYLLARAEVSIELL